MIMQSVLQAYFYPPKCHLQFEYALVYNIIVLKNRHVSDEK